MLNSLAVACLFPPLFSKKCTTINFSLIFHCCLFFCDKRFCAFLFFLLSITTILTVRVIVEKNEKKHVHHFEIGGNLTNRCWLSKTIFSYYPSKIFLKKVVYHLNDDIKKNVKKKIKKKDQFFNLNC